MKFRKKVAKMKKQNIESRIVESLNERTPDTLNAIKKSMLL